MDARFLTSTDSAYQQNYQHSVHIPLDVDGFRRSAALAPVGLTVGCQAQLSSAVSCEPMSPNFWPTTLVDWSQVFSAVGTVGAVIVALFLAHRKPTPQLSGTARVSIVIARNLTPAPEFFDVRVTNVGNVDAIVTTLGWCRLGWIRPHRQQYYQDLPDDPILTNPRLPVRLRHGESTSFHLPLTGPARWTATTEERGFFPESVHKRADLDRVRVVVATTVGRGLRIRPGPDVLDRIWTAHELFLANQRRTAATQISRPN